MGAAAVLSYLQGQLQGHNFGTPITVVTMPCPRQPSMQEDVTRLFVFPRIVKDDRTTMGGEHGYRALTYPPIDLTLRQTVDPVSTDWLAFLRLSQKIQAFLRSLGDLTPIPITDSVTHEDTYITRIEEHGEVTFSYANVLRQDAPVTTQAMIAATVTEQMQGPGVF